MDDRLVLVDTNVLLSASTPARVEHGDALRILNQWPKEEFRLCTSGQILGEYLVVATRPSIRTDSHCPRRMPPRTSIGCERECFF
ncbi:MAG TPA: PIN domain-containing protein [Vicinamibacteria bacterium]|nr:PIN domain-containing protein [Vicinamibacteria bacterium]